VWKPQSCPLGRTFQITSTPSPPKLAGESRLVGIHRSDYPDLAIRDLRASLFAATRMRSVLVRPGRERPQGKVEVDETHMSQEESGAHLESVRVCFHRHPTAYSNSPPSTIRALSRLVMPTSLSALTSCPTTGASGHVPEARGWPTAQMEE